MENINLIHHVANLFAKKSTVDYQDLFGEASLAYCVAKTNYDPNRKTKFTTYAYTCMYNHLINVCKKEYRKQSKTADELNEEQLRCQDQKFCFEEYTDGWPESCKTVARVVLDNPDYFLGETIGMKRTGGVKERIKNELIHRKGWTHKNVQDVFRELPSLV